MENPTIGDILRVAVEQKLPVSIRYLGADDQNWFGPMPIDREKAAEICLKGAAVRITFFIPEQTAPIR